MPTMDIVNALDQGGFKCVELTLGRGEDAPMIKLRVRKIDSSMLAEQGSAILFTDIPPDLDILQIVDGVQDVVDAEGNVDKSAMLRQALDRIKALGPGFVKRQASQVDAIVCAGVREIWQPIDDPDDLPGESEAVERAKVDGGYWKPFRFVMREQDSSPADGRLHVNRIGYESRKKISAAITRHSAGDGEVADLLRTFRDDAGDI